MSNTPDITTLDLDILIVVIVSSAITVGVVIVVLVYFGTQLQAWYLHAWPAPAQPPIPLQPIPFLPHNVPFRPLPPQNSPRSLNRRTNESESEGPIAGPSRPRDPIRPRPGTPGIEEDVTGQGFSSSSPETLLRQSPPPLSENPLRGLWATNPDPQGRFPSNFSSESSSPDPEAIPVHQTPGAGPSQPIRGPTPEERLAASMGAQGRAPTGRLSQKTKRALSRAEPPLPHRVEEALATHKLNETPFYPNSDMLATCLPISVHSDASSTDLTESGRTSPTSSNASSENIEPRHGTSEEQIISDEEERTREQWNSTEELEAMRSPHHSDDGNKYMDLDPEPYGSKERERENTSSRNWASSRQPGRGTIVTSPTMSGWEKQTYSEPNPFGGTTTRNPFWPPRPLPDSPLPRTRTQGYYPWPTQGRLFARADPGEGSKKGKWNEGLDPMQEEEARIKQEDAATERKQREAEIAELTAKLEMHNKFWDLDPPEKGKGPAEPALPIPPRPHRGRRPPDPPPPRPPSIGRDHD
ncbi:hypothetical protein IW261DRAFT_1573518 [Armillaria novae-zelandiae]|uniref:Uncharacterized protein n=1 Tax=Armillaria novae-zelandiae TaxID=153914 RepID=A0AA39TSA0_9AGAR|nr:hypothetical protein IW261DRAFT_1573518 [Armillaria novae-zelandiae]